MLLTNVLRIIAHYRTAGAAYFALLV